MSPRGDWQDLEDEGVRIAVSWFAEEAAENLALHRMVSTTVICLKKCNLLGLKAQMETSSSGPDLSPGPETIKPFLLQAESSLEVGWESTGQKLGC